MDSEYLKIRVGKALSEGLAEVCLKRPVDPVEYLACWLRKYVENEAHNEKQKEEEIQVVKEREIAAKEALYRARMKEEAEQLAMQEAYARAAAEPIVIDNTPRPMPPELNQTLETVTEQGEEEEPAAEGNEEKREATDAEPETENQLEQPLPQESSLTEIPEEPAGEAVADETDEAQNETDEGQNETDEGQNTTNEVVDVNDQDTAEDQS